MQYPLKTFFQDLAEQFPTAGNFVNTGVASVNQIQSDVFKTVTNFPNDVVENEYEKTTDVFPEDLGMDYYGHYVKIKAFTGGYQSSGALSYSPPSYEAWNGYLFIPGGQQGGQAPLIYDHRHNFTDIRLTNIFNDSILGISMAMTTKRSINPMVQVLYRSTNLRQFDFSFFMAPKSPREARAMKNIAKKMRMFSAPEINGAAVIAPAEFEFEFYNKGQRDTNLPFIERCVITAVTANFAPVGDYSSFKDGYPVSCLLTFSATEVRLIDRNKVNQGY